jgi:tight adherence protein C
MTSSLLPILISLLSSFIVWRIGTLVRLRISRRSSQRYLAQFDHETSNNSSPQKEKEKIAGFLIQARSSLLNTPYGKWLQELSVKAGRWEESDLALLTSRKFQSLSLALIFLFFLSRVGATPKPLFALLLLTLAFFFPDLSLYRRSTARIKEIEDALPETIELLSMCVHAGLGFQAGMQRVAQTRSNPLSEEFNRVLAEMRIGEGRSQAFSRMSDRLAIEPLRQFVNAVLQVDRLGVPIAKVLDDQSERIRSIRRESAREQAQKVPVKILAPIMLFLMPAVFIIVLGPAVITIIRSFSQ